MKTYKEFLVEARKKTLKLKVADVVKAAGGKAVIKKKCKFSDCAYEMLVDAQEKLIKEKSPEYTEVIEASETALMDFADGILPQEGAADIMKRLDPSAYKKLEAMDSSGSQDKEAKKIVSQFLKKYDIRDRDTTYFLYDIWGVNY